MKKLFFAFILLGGSLAFQSCKDDDKPSNQVSYDGEKAKITSVVRASGSSEEGEGLYVHNLFVLSGTLNFDGNTFAGAGDMLILSLANGSEDQITPGTYTVGENLEDGAMYAQLYIDLDADEEQIGDIIAADSGTISIEKNGDNYTIVFNLVIDGKKLTGSYKGKITTVNIQG